MFLQAFDWTGKDLSESLLPCHPQQHWG